MKFTVCFIVVILVSCTPSNNLKNSIQKLNNTEKELAEKCLSKTNTLDHNQITVEVLKNEFDPKEGYYRVVLNYDTSNFIRCDYNLMTQDFIKAEQIIEGKISQVY